MKPVASAPGRFDGQTSGQDNGQLPGQTSGQDNGQLPGHTRTVPYEYRTAVTRLTTVF